jgi:NADH:ubiquinone oxidoreductase subunit 6 (subunit J)
MLVAGYTDLHLFSSTGDSFIFWLNTLDSVNNLELLGQLIYTYFAHLLFISGMILLVAMIGAIVLTLDN